MAICFTIKPPTESQLNAGVADWPETYKRKTHKKIPDPLLGSGIFLWVLNIN